MIYLFFFNAFKKQELGAKAWSFFGFSMIHTASKVHIFLSTVKTFLQKAFGFSMWAAANCSQGRRCRFTVDSDAGVPALNLGVSWDLPILCKSKALQLRSSQVPWTFPLFWMLVNECCQTNPFYADKESYQLYVKLIEVTVAKIWLYINTTEF